MVSGMKGQSNIGPTLGGNLIRGREPGALFAPTHPVREQGGRNEGSSWGSLWIR
jgi:hypothetical protein